MAAKRREDLKLINAVDKKFKMSKNRRGKLQYSGMKTENIKIPFVLKKTKDGGYVCQVCFVTFSSLNTLKRHIARFQDPKYPCDKCGTKFTSMHILQSHVTFTHGAETLKNYRTKCPVCNQHTHVEATLRSHICHVHSEWVKTNFAKFTAEYSAAEGETSFAAKNCPPSSWNRYMMIRFVRHIIANTTNNDNETAPERNGLSNNNYYIQQEGLSKASKLYRDAESLRVRYSCKDCYVPLVRIDSRKDTPIKLVTPVKKRKISPAKKSSYRANVAKSPEEMSPVKRRKRDKPKQLGLADIRMCPDKLPESNVFVKSECKSYENFEISIPVTEPLEECADPLDLGEFPTETTSALAQYSTLCELPVKIEYPEARTGNPEQCEEMPVDPVKVEPMDCNDSSERIEVTNCNDSSERREVTDCKDSSERIKVTDTCLESQDNTDKPETVQYYYGEPSVDFTDASVDCMDAFEPVKVEIEEHPIPEYSECRSEGAVESPEIPDANSRTIETSSLSTAAPEEMQVQEGWTMVASKICNKLFTSRRTMLRHFRKRHLSCFDDTVYCVCGKEMNGRRAMEKHFSRHCDRLVKTTRNSSEHKLCKPLEKKFQCAKCDQKFWLPTCLEDHPPNCELPKPKPVNPCRLIKNINRAYGLTSHLGEVGEYICRICDVKFTSIDTLLRHLRSFSSNEKKSTCVHCGTVFTGPRLLKGHVQSTHELNSTTTYTYFCEICNQGFTKKINQRIHTMHIHPNEVMKRVIEGPTDYVSPTNNDAPVVASTPENQCNVCNLVFVSRKRFMDHVSYYNKGAHYRCNICGEQFDGQYKAHHHRKKVHYGGKIKTTYTHYCDLCKEGFMYKTHLHAHMFHVHDDEFNCVTSVKDYNLPQENEQSAKGFFPCNLCSKTFSTPSILFTHMDVHHGEDPTKINSVKCSHCDRHFTTLAACINHLKHSHNNVPPLVSDNSQGVQSTHNSSAAIDVIDISISDENDEGSVDPNVGETQPHKTDEANVEKQANEDDVAKSSVCFTCGFDCPGPWGLARHRALYLNSGIYACEFCGRRFSWQTYYRDHKLKHFRRDVHNNFFCPICDEGFDTVNDLKMHAIHLHPEPFDALNCGPVPNTSRANIFRDEGNDSNCIGNPHQPHTVTLSNDCDSKYGQVVQLPENARTVFKQNRVASDITEDSSNSLNRYPTCNICNMAFISKEMLYIHRENSHSGVPSWLSTANEAKTSQVNDRFYILLGEKVHARAVDSIGKKIAMCDKNIGLTKKLYRYDVPMTCDVCNLTFQSKDMLLNHREFLHKIEKNFVFQSTSDDGKQSPEKNVVNKPERAYQEPGGERVHLKVRSTAPISVLRSGKKQLQAVATSPETSVGEAYCSKCRLCDIVFTDKNLMAIHNVKIHGLRNGDDNTVDDVTLQPLGSVADASRLGCVDNLWIGSKNQCDQPMPPLTSCSQYVPIVNPVAKNTSPEEILISDEDTEVSIEPISTAPNPSFSRDKESTSPPLRLINLPPGNYKISKLKIRSTDTGKVTKLSRNTK